MKSFASLTLLLLAFLTGYSGQAYSDSSSQSSSIGCPLQIPSVIPTKLRVFFSNFLLSPQDPFFVSVNSSACLVVDLLSALQKKTGIPYTLTDRSDLNHGRQNPNGSFDGSLAGALINNEADLVPFMTVSAAREAAVDFLAPTTSYQLQILINPNFGQADGTQYLALDNPDLTYLKNSKDASIQKIYTNIDAGRPGSLVDSQASGLEKVLSGNYAFIAVSSFADQALVDNPGKVTRAPGRLRTNYNAMAVQQGSPLREKLNLAILQLLDDGSLEAILNKYGA